SSDLVRPEEELVRPEEGLVGPADHAPPVSPVAPLQVVPPVASSSDRRHGGGVTKPGRVDDPVSSGSRPTGYAGGVSVDPGPTGYAGGASAGPGATGYAGAP